MATNEQDPPDFEFDSWARMASEDPSSFEDARRRMLESLIDSAPEHAQTRLRGLQWQVDRMRELHPPLSACVKITNLMWDQVLGENGLIANVERLIRNPEPEGRPTAKSTATVLPFTPRH
jgi:hypothetical protein